MEDLSDNEREEQLRRWWTDNWLWILGGIALGLGLLAGWQYWQKSQLRERESDESAYVAVLDALSANDASGAAKKASDLRSLHPKSPYADQSDLALARAAVERGDLDDAARRLRIVADASRDEQLRQIARARLARVLGEQGKYDDALKLVAATDAGAFAPLYNEVRGDLLAAKGDLAGAKQAYDSALTESANPEGTAIDKAYVELKRDALGVAAPVAAAPAQAPATAGTSP